MSAITAEAKGAISCPFCNSMDTYCEGDRDPSGLWSVECDGCGGGGPRSFTTPAEAVAAWNMARIMKVERSGLVAAIVDELKRQHNTAHDYLHPGLYAGQLEWGDEIIVDGLLDVGALVDVIMNHTGAE